MGVTGERQPQASDQGVVLLEAFQTLCATSPRAVRTASSAAADNGSRGEAVR